MLETITAAYLSDRNQADLSELVMNTLATPYTQLPSQEDYAYHEKELHTDFVRFIGNRMVAATREHYSEFGTRRWTVRAYTPVDLAQHPSGSILKAIPFTETKREWAGRDNHQIAYGIFMTAFSARRTLTHTSVARPWLRHRSKRLAIARRMDPYLPTVESKVSEESLTTQANFRRMLMEIIIRDEAS